MRNKFRVQAADSLKCLDRILSEKAFIGEFAGQLPFKSFAPRRVLSASQAEFRIEPKFPIIELIPDRRSNSLCP